MADPQSIKEARRKGALVTNSKITPVQRFWLKVQKSEGCWEWHGQRNHKGYGEISINNRWYKAHRYSWVLVHGPIAKGLQVCHHCDNRACVRPDHLFVGNNSDNQRDAVKKGRGPAAKISPEDVRTIRGLLAQGLNAAQTARQSGFSYPTVLRVKNRKAFFYVE